MKSIADGFSGLKKKNMTDKIHDEILEMIIKEGPGKETVLTEGCLVEKFGVSKAPVREALIRLCSENVLQSIPRFGYVVVQMEERDAEEIAGIRILLETEALKAGFDRIISCHLEAIRTQIEEKEKSTGQTDIWQIWDDNEEFHLMLASFAGNQMLGRFLKESLHIQKRVYAQLHWNRLSTLRAEFCTAPHRKIYEALCEKNLEKSMKALQEDIRL